MRATDSSHRPVARRDMTGAVIRRVVGSLCLSLIALGAVACRGDGLRQAPQEIEELDSAQIVRIAAHVLDSAYGVSDCIPYEAWKYSRDTCGIVVSLIPAPPESILVHGGAGVVCVSPDGAVTQVLELGH